VNGDLTRSGLLELKALDASTALAVATFCEVDDALADSRRCTFALRRQQRQQRIN